MENVQNQVQNRRLIILNALPLNIFQRTAIILRIVPLQPEELRHLATNNEVIHFIRHVATLNLLRTLIPSLSPEPNAGIYRYQPGDLLAVVTLRTPNRGQEQIVNLTDLDMWLVEVLQS